MTCLSFMLKDKCRILQYQVSIWHSEMQDGVCTNRGKIIKYKKKNWKLFSFKGKCRLHHIDPRLSQILRSKAAVRVQYYKVGWIQSEESLAYHLFSTDPGCSVLRLDLLRLWWRWVGRFLEWFSLCISQPVSWISLVNFSSLTYFVSFLLSLSQDTVQTTWNASSLKLRYQECFNFVLNICSLPG